MTGSSTTSSSVTVTVNQTPSAVTVNPGTASVGVQATQQFSASISSRFGNTMNTTEPQGGISHRIRCFAKHCHRCRRRELWHSINFHEVIEAWNSAIVDPLRNRMVIWGGGHLNYFGNEIYSLNMNDSPPSLTRLNDPSQSTPPPQFYVDPGRR